MKHFSSMSGSSSSQTATSSHPIPYHLSLITYLPEMSLRRDADTVIAPYTPICSAARHRRCTAHEVVPLHVQHRPSSHPSPSGVSASGSGSSRSIATVIVAALCFIPRLRPPLQPALPPPPPLNSSTLQTAQKVMHPPLRSVHTGRCTQQLLDCPHRSLRSCSEGHIFGYISW